MLFKCRAWEWWAIAGLVILGLLLLQIVIIVFSSISRKNIEKGGYTGSPYNPETDIWVEHEPGFQYGRDDHVYEAWRTWPGNGADMTSSLYFEPRGGSYQSRSYDGEHLSSSTYITTPSHYAPSKYKPIKEEYYGNVEITQDNTLPTSPMNRHQIGPITRFDSYVRPNDGKQYTLETSGLQG